MDLGKGALCSLMQGKSRDTSCALLSSARSGKHVTEPLPTFSLTKPTTNKMTFSFTQYPHLVFKVKEFTVSFISLIMREEYREYGSNIMLVL